MSWKRVGGASLVMGLAALGACGENLFNGPPVVVEDEEPTVLAVTVPEFVRPNDILRIEIEAVAPEGITAVDVTLVEATVQEETVEVDPPDPDVEVAAEFRLPSPLVRESVLVSVEVEDALGARSEAFEVEIPVIQDEDDDF